MPARIRQTVPARLDEQLRNDTTVAFSTYEAAQFANLINDPFGYCDNPVPIPDGDARKVLLMTLRTRASYAMATNPDGTHAATAGGFIQLFGLTGASSTAAQSLVITYGSSPDDPAASQLYYVKFNDTVTSALGTVGAGSGTFRRVCSALRVVGTGIDTESAVLSGGSNAFCLMNTSSTMTSNGPFTDAMDGNSYTIKDGIMTRPLVPSVNAWPAVGVNGFAMPAGPYKSDGVIPWGDSPTVKFTSLSATTVLNIEGVHVYEVEPTYRVANSLIEPVFCSDAQQIVYIANTRPLTTTAHSFKGLLKWTGRAVKNVGNFLWKNVLSKPATKLASKAQQRLESAVDAL
jgi:hypothetical protein